MEIVVEAQDIGVSGEGKEEGLDSLGPTPDAVTSDWSHKEQVVLGPEQSRSGSVREDRRSKQQNLGAWNREDDTV